MITYQRSGVNQKIGNTCSKIMYEASKKTWKNRKDLTGEIKPATDNFSGLRIAELNNTLPIQCLLNFDGVGTKIEIAERLSSLTNDFIYHKGIAHDMFAMVCDDAVIRGAEPVIIGSILDVNKLNLELVKNLANGMIEAASLANVAVINGEIAELGNRINGYGNYNYNWGASVFSVINKKNIITGKEIKKGDCIIAFKEDGLRSNGFSLARKILESKLGKEWHQKNKHIAEKLLVKSQIYAKAILEIIEKVKPKGVAHITGGGIPEKLGRILKPSKKGAVLNNLFSPPEVVNYLQKLGEVSDEEAYKTWNMGNGMLIITAHPEETIKIAEKHKIKARVAGEIINENLIKIKSKGFFRKDCMLDF